MRLETFGGLALVRDPGDALAIGRRQLALLSLLAVAGEKGLSRERVIALLWPERDNERGRNSLSQLLSGLRRDVPECEIVVGGADLRLNDAAVVSDVAEFERLVSTASDLERAAALYKGPFLDGVYLRNAPEYERWVEQQRFRYREMSAVALRKLADQADRSGNLAAAVEYWQSLAALDPGASAGALGLMSALARSGHRAAALRHFRVYEAYLRNELGAAVDEHVRQFAEELRSASAAEPIVERPTPEHAAAERAPDRASMNGTVAASMSTTTTPARSATWRRRQLSLGLSLLGVVMVTTLALRHRGRSPDDPRHRVGVMAFLNETGDTTLDSFGLLASQFISDAIQRSGIADAVDPAATILSRDGRQVAGTGDSQSPESWAKSNNASVVVTGRYFRDGDSILVAARASDMHSERVIGSSSATHLTIGAPLIGLGRLRQQVLGIIATHFDAHIADLLPVGSSLPTLDAYNEFVEGVRAFRDLRFAEALPHFVNAHARDSGFVEPLMWQEFALGSLGRRHERPAVTRELAAHRESLSPLQSRALEYFEADDRGDPLAMVEALRAASSLAPGSIWSYNLGGVLDGLGRYEEAVAALSQVENNGGWTRNWLSYWRALGRALHNIDPARELALIQQAQTVIGQGGVGLRLNMDKARALAALGRQHEIDSLVREMRAAPVPARRTGPIPANVLDIMAVELWERGDTTQSRELLRYAVEWFERLPAGTLDARPELRDIWAWVLYDADRFAEARPYYERVAATTPADWESIMYLGLCLAHLGERQRATEIMNRLLAAADSIDDPHTLVGGAAQLRAARIAAVLGDRDRAVGLITQVNARTGALLPRHLEHKDFDALRAYGPFLRVTRPPN